MKGQNYFLVWAVLFGFFSFISCTNDPITEDVPQLDNLSGETQKELVGIPYAKESDLQAFSSDDEIVDYNFSREVALIDLQDFKKDTYQNKGNLTLSELPVIVYDNDNKPKFYEFIVYDNDKEVGTITCFAKKEVPGFTAYVLPFVRNYNETNSTKYSSVYPASAEENTSSVTARKALSDEELKVQEEAKSFWSNIGDETELLTAKNTNTTARFIDAWNEHYTIPQFNRDNLKRTRFGGWCGPGALAWLYRAYYSTYKNTYYPLHGEKSSSKLGFYTDHTKNISKYYYEKSPLYKDLAEKCRVGYGPDPFKGVTLPGDLINAVNSIFPNHKLEVTFTSPLGNARRSIENNNPTVLLMNGGKKLKINGIKQLHYVVGFGTKNRYNTYNLWLFKVRKVHTDSWIYVTDNGASTERHGFLPYYMNTHAILGKDFVTYTLYRK